MLQWSAFSEKYPDIYAALSAPQLEQVQHFWCCSEFAYQQCLQDSQILSLCLQQTAELNLTEAMQSIITQANTCQNTEQLHQILYQAKQQAMVIIAWHQLILHTDILQILEVTSYVADVILQLTVQHCYRFLQERLATPMLDETQPMPLYILALGKLGGYELNFSSDVDIIFAYAADGLLVTRGREITHQHFFTQLVQSCVQVLHPTQHPAWIYRVDLRLRPYGGSGALASSFAALEKYYQEQGRDWERYAILKARIINPDQHCQALQALLKAFVYRRYSDYAIFAALRDMKLMIEEQGKAHNQQQDIKRGEGGIREVEFTIQAIQILQGGRTHALCTPSIITAMQVCLHEKLLPAEQVMTLLQGYRFLRTLENCLQIYDNRQVHDLPQDPLLQTRIATAMEYTDPQGLLTDLNQVKQQVNHIFRAIIMPDKQEERSFNLFAPDINQKRIQDYLQSLGFAEDEALVNELLTLRKYIFSREATSIARNRMAKLLPTLLERLKQESNPGKVLQQLMPLLIAISLRSAYLVLLLENKNTLNWLVVLAKTSQWIMTRITEFPILLDELLYPQNAMPQITNDSLGQELTKLTASIAQSDIEQQMQVLRQFKLRNELLIAIKQLDQDITTKQVGELLTTLAIVILQQVFQWAWQQVVERYGVLSDAPTLEAAQCVIIAYGNLGSYSMNYQSDLDLVMLYQATPEVKTLGKKTISAMEFYVKLFQRMLTMLNTRTLSGVLYQTDTRLRPAGGEGLLVATLQSFTQYQQQDAWTFEHQSLVKARPILGNPGLMQSFAQLRIQILQQAKKAGNLKENIILMRKRLLQQKKSPINPNKAFKNCAGGIVDIDFMVQYSVLNWADQYPELLNATESVVIIQQIAAAGLWPAQSALAMIQIYEVYQFYLQVLAIKDQLSPDEVTQALACQEKVKAFWQYLFEEEYNV